MKKLCSLLSLCLILVMTTTAFAAVFPDMPEDHWAYSAVDKMQTDGRVNGFPDGTFKPDELVTRWQFAKMAGGDPDQITRPDVPATREEAANYLWERAGKPVEEAPASATRQAYYKEAVAWAYARGVMIGDDGVNLRLESTLTRAEAATMIVRCEGELGHVNFVDVVSQDVLRTLWENLGTGFAYDENATLTNGQLARIAMKIGRVQDKPNYQNMRNQPAFEGEYAKDVQLVAEECLGVEKATEAFMNQPANMQDAVAMLSFYTMRQVKGDIVSGAETYTDATLTANGGKVALRFARANGVLLYGEPKLNAAATATMKELAGIMLQLDEGVGLTSAYGEERNTRYLKQPYPYPANRSDYAYVIEDIPVSVYEAPIAEGVKPIDYTAFGDDFARTFASFLNGIAAKFPEDLKYAWSYYPSQVVRTKNDMILRVGLEIKQNPDGLTLNQLMPQNTFEQTYYAARYVIDISVGTPVIDLVLDSSKYKAIRAFEK